jgi:hypothetical protein
MAVQLFDYCQNFMGSVTLVLGSSNFNVAAPLLRHNSNLLFANPDLQTYAVQTRASTDIFQEFLNALEQGSDLRLTTDNISELSSLCDEFRAERLQRSCEAFVGPVLCDSAIDFRFATHECLNEERGAVTLSNVEGLRRESASLRADLNALRDSVAGQFRALEANAATTAASIAGLPDLKSEFDRLSSAFRELREDFRRGGLKFTQKDGKPLNGIISYVTRKSGGNVHKKGAVVITSSSVYEDYTQNSQCSQENVAELTSDSLFCSIDAPGQWICWDFRERRIWPTHYTIRTGGLKSWAIEGSEDGTNWTEVDRQTDNEDFNQGWNSVSFPVSKPEEFRFIRLTQTGKNHRGFDVLGLFAVEFFGTLSE